MSSLDWMDRAECQYHDPELFFSEKRTAEALEVCGLCPVRQECKDYAVNPPKFQMPWNRAPYQVDMIGVWGGTTEGEREAVRRRGADARCVNVGCTNVARSPGAWYCQTCVKTRRRVSHQDHDKNQRTRVAA